LWGVGPKTATILSDMGIRSVADLARQPVEVLKQRFGSMGADLYRRARGLDDRPVETSQVTKSISQEITFERDIVDGRRLRTTLMNMSEQVAYRLRQKGLCASTVRIKIRWPDFQTHTRQVTLAQPTDQDSVIAESALTLFEQIWQSGRAVRLLGVGASGLSDCAHQLSLWETGGDKERRLLEAMDELRERYGRSVVKKGSNLKGKG
jgi:DNA polymerase-4